jgi:hypothetical protein
LLGCVRDRTVIFNKKRANCPHTCKWNQTGVKDGVRWNDSPPTSPFDGWAIEENNSDIFSPTIAK